MREYRCRYCGWWLFSSDAACGHVEVWCRNRRCDRRQTVRLAAPLAGQLRPAPLPQRVSGPA